MPAHIHNTNMRLLKYISCIIAGAFLPCAFSPLQIWPISILSPLVLLHCWRKATPRQAFGLGWVYGYAFFTVGIGWAQSCYIQTGFTKPIAILCMIVFIAILAVFTALPGYIIKKFYSSYSNKALCFAFPCSWVILEWVRSWLWTGFPWLLMGYTQIDSPLRNYAPIVGVYGLSFLLLLSIALLYTILDFSKRWSLTKDLALCLIIVIWLGGYALKYISWTSLLNKEHTVSIVQANITPQAKDRLTLDDHRRIYGPLTQSSVYSEFVIWPETSVPYFIPYSQPLLDELDKIGKQFNTTFIVGVMAEALDHTRYENAFIALGNGSGRYNKQHLIPLWEYVPHENYLIPVLDYLKVRKPRVIHGTAGQQKLQIQGTVILPLICYEIAFPQAVRRDLLATGANVIFNISEDGWYADTWAIGQNLDMVRMRALENGRYIVKSTGSGLSTIVDNKGNIVVIAKPYTPQVIQGTFKDATGFTPWTKLGAAKLMAIFALLWGVSLVFGWQFERRSKV
jgi:apolipoprotein N-acyltransferase